MRKILSAALALVCVWFATPVYAALPSGYTELEYIQSTGTQYIDTGIYGELETELKFVGQVTQYYAGGNYAHLWGDLSDNTRAITFTSTKLESASTTLRFGDKATNIASSPVKMLPLNETVTIIENKEKATSSNGIEVIFNATEEFTTNKTLSLFAANSSTGVTAARHNFKCFYFSHKKNGILVQELIPARRNSDNEVGMYDTVNDVFYKNKGTGEFIAGAPVVDNSCRNLFDQSTATRYKTSWANSGDGSWQAVSSSSEAVAYGSYVKPNTTYTLSKKGGSRLIITGYRTKTEPSSSATPADYKIRTDTAEVVDGSYTFTTPADCTWILFGLRQNNSTPTFPYDVQLEQGDTATEYVPYNAACHNNKIKIATTKYNESAFGPLNTALQNAISVVDSVVTQTITQAASIATLQSQKQTRPADDPSDANNAENCPAGKKCLLVEDASGIPHWYEIVENAWDLPAGYTQLEYIESTGTQYIDTGYTVTSNVVEYGVEIYGGPGNKKSIFGSENKSVDVKYSGIPYVVDGSVGLYAGSTLSPVANVQFPASQWNTYIVSVTSATALNVSLNGAVRNGTYAGGVQNGKPIYLFTNNGDEAQITSQKISNRIRRFYIKDNNSIVRDFVPAQHGSDVGMYDLVSGQFFTNAGTGDFVAGPVAE